MKIVTVNLPEWMLETIERLVYDPIKNPWGLYNSRTELMRCAVRAFLLKEIARAEEIIAAKEGTKKPELITIDEDKFIRIPNDKEEERKEDVQEFTCYKIIKRLDHANPHLQKKDRPPQPRPNPLPVVNAFPTWQEIERTRPSFQQLRAQHPNEPFYKYINEDLEQRV